MGKVALAISVGLTIILGCEGFYKPSWHQHLTLPTYTPKTLEEVKKYLCMDLDNDHCNDESPGRIVINKIFDFTGSEGMKKEVGCYHKTSPKECLTSGQLKLNTVNQCDGLAPANVLYSEAGKCGIFVGSNKIIVGENGGGFKGKGLKLRKSKNVEIRNLRITDINYKVIWGGDAIDLVNAKNVLIDGNYFKNIGRQMIVTHFGSNTAITISNNVFDGNTLHSALCNGAHYWLWLFLGKGDVIALQNNVILNTSGRGPHIVATDNSASLVHIIQNTFYDIKDLGLIDLTDKNSCVLLEGNVFFNVKEVVRRNNGHIFMPKTSADQQACEAPLGRKCLRNVVVNSEKANPKNSLQVLEHFKPFKNYMVKPINMKTCMTHLINIPQEVQNHIH